MSSHASGHHLPGTFFRSGFGIKPPSSRLSARSNTVVHSRNNSSSTASAVTTTSAGNASLNVVDPSIASDVVLQHTNRMKRNTFGRFVDEDASEGGPSNRPSSTSGPSQGLQAPSVVSSRDSSGYTMATKEGIPRDADGLGGVDVDDNDDGEEEDHVVGRVDEVKARAAHPKGQHHSTSTSNSNSSPNLVPPPALQQASSSSLPKITPPPPPPVSFLNMGGEDNPSSPDSSPSSPVVSYSTHPIFPTHNQAHGPAHHHVSSIPFVPTSSASASAAASSSTASSSRFPSSLSSSQPTRQQRISSAQQSLLLLSQRSQQPLPPPQLLQPHPSSLSAGQELTGSHRRRRSTISSGSPTSHIPPQQQQQQPPARPHSSRIQHPYQISEEEYVVHKPSGPPLYIDLSAPGGGIGESPVPSIRSLQQQSHEQTTMPMGWSTGRREDLREREGGEKAREVREAKEAIDGDTIGRRRRTLSQRSSLASLFEKRHSLLKKLSKWGFGGGGGAQTKVNKTEKMGRVERDENSILDRVNAADQFQPARARAPETKKGQVEQPRLQLQRAVELQVEPPLWSRAKPDLRIDPPAPRSSGVMLVDADVNVGVVPIGHDSKGMPGVVIVLNESHQDAEDNDGGFRAVPRSPVSSQRESSPSEYTPSSGQPPPHWQAQMQESPQSHQQSPLRQSHTHTRSRSNSHTQQYQSHLPTRTRSVSHPPPSPTSATGHCAPSPYTPPSYDSENSHTSNSMMTFPRVPDVAVPASAPISATGSAVVRTFPLPRAVTAAEDEDRVDSYYDILISSAKRPNTQPSMYSSSSLSRPSPAFPSIALSHSTSSSREAGAGGGSISMRSTTASHSREDSSDGKGRHPYAYAFGVPSGQIDPENYPRDEDREANKKTDGMQGRRLFNSRLSPIPSHHSVTLRTSISTPEFRASTDLNMNASKRSRLREGGGGGGVVAASEDNHAQGVGIDVSRLRPLARQKLLFASNAAAAAAAGGGGDGKEKWLSTGMVAMLLPKPTLKAKAKRGEEEEALTKLNTSYSRSLIDLANAAGYPGGVSSVGHEGDDGGVGVGSSLGHGRGMTSKSVGAIDMSEFGVRELARSNSQSGGYDPSFASLDRVLQEGENLEQDRRKWQAQASKSLGNKHARTVSRSRSKSLTQAGRKLLVAARGHNPRHQQSSIDFLTARACLGNQDIVPLVEESDEYQRSQSVPGTPWLKRERHERKPSTSSGVATMSVSLAPSQKSQTTSADTHEHKRGESWSQSALRLAKSLPQLCGLVADDDKVPEEKNAPRYQQQPTRSELVGLEAALRNGETKIIKFADPASALSPTADGIDNRKPSPSPSGTSETMAVGIAISTPQPLVTRGTAYAYPDHPYTIGADRVGVRAQFGEEAGPSIQNSGILLHDHPYAQGGLPQMMDYAGPHPASAAMAAELMTNLGFSEVSARHRLPPQMTLPHSRQASQHYHPQQRDLRQTREQPLYIKVENPRNSYQDLRRYLRLDSNVPASDRLWVAYSPGSVREVISSDLFRYSPSVAGDQNGTGNAGQSRSGDDGPDLFLQRYQRMSTIYQDTASMSEALATAMYDAYDTRLSTIAEPRSSLDSGLGTSEEQPSREGGQVVLDVPETIVESMDSRTSLEQPPPQAMSSSNITPAQHDAPPAQKQPDLALKLELSSTAPPPLSVPEFLPTITLSSSFSPISKEDSSYSSPPTSPVPRVGSPDNLEPFRNLFYKPPDDSETDSLSSRDIAAEDPSHLLESLQWDAGHYPNRKIGSGLTTLMKEMSEELEKMALERQHSRLAQSSDPQMIPSSAPESSSPLSVPGDEMTTSHMSSEAGPLRFVLGGRSRQSRYIPRPDTPTFYPTNPIPEDIESSRASSPFEGTIEDETTVRLPTISVETITASNDAPQGDQISYVPRPDLNSEPSPSETLLSARNLSPDLSRASYQTTSTLSRMSALSDFPTPPDRITPEEISLLNAIHNHNTITSTNGDTY